jgi:hypothetical protein
MSNRVLFISGRCPHSKKVLLGIHQHRFLKEIFEIVNIDIRPYPNYIKSVPSVFVNNQVISGDKVFEYFGKIVESKMAQEERESQGKLEASDQGVCKINEDGELEGYCGDFSGIGFSAITDENDDYKSKRYRVETSYDFLENSDSSSTVYQKVQAMETGDQMLSEKRKGFDSDYERLQAERGELMGGQGPQGGMQGRAMNGGGRNLMI